MEEEIINSVDPIPAVIENCLMNDDNEILASGELYKQTASDSKAWVLRNFTLRGVYLSYSTTDGVKKGQIDITDCKIKIATDKECENPSARYAFAIITKKKIH